MLIMAPTQWTAPLLGQSGPSSLTARVTGGSVTLNWSASADAVGHRVEAGSAPGLTDLAMVAVASPPAVFHNVPIGTYHVRVRAAVGAGWSTPSNEVVVRVSCLAPGAPSSLDATVNGTLVGLGWEGDENGSYVIEAGSAPGLTDIASLPVAGTRFVVDAPPGRYFVRVRSVGPCGLGTASAETVVAVGVTTANPIYGEVDPEVLGTCSAAAHDAYVVDGGDGYRYRTWHPQVDPSGCVYAHEHGDNPNVQANLDIRSAPVRFGFISRRMGQVETHEGYKVFVANRGDVDAQGATSAVDSRIVLHMGTGDPQRFSTQYHSLEQRVSGPGGIRVAVQVMADSGGTDSACAPSAPAGKRVSSADPACPLRYPVETWGLTVGIQFQDRPVYLGWAGIGVIGPITALDPTSPARLLYVWDPAMAVVNRDGLDWSSARGCDRVAYHAVGYVLNAGQYDTERSIFYTDALGEEVLPNDPAALRQEVGQRFAIAPPATEGGEFAFAAHHDHCGLWTLLGVRN